MGEVLEDVLALLGVGAGMMLALTALLANDSSQPEVELDKHHRSRTIHSQEDRLAA